MTLKKARTPPFPYIIHLFSHPLVTKAEPVYPVLVKEMSATPLGKLFPPLMGGKAPIFSLEHWRVNDAMSCGSHLGSMRK